MVGEPTPQVAVIPSARNSSRSTSAVPTFQSDGIEIAYIDEGAGDPILLIHGEVDDNTGTFPIQSERLYAAVRGNGGTVRLVMLPGEAHGYRGIETMEHVLWEEITWFDKYLKN